MSPVRQIVLPALAMSGIVLLSNILVGHPINGWLTWGAFSYPVTYFVTDVCNRLAGPQLARRVAWVGFCVGVLLSAHFANWQIAGASGTAFIVSQLLDVFVFNKLRQKSWWMAPLWGSITASIVDTAIFFSIAFAGTPVRWVQLAAGDLGAKFLMAFLLLIPFRAVVRRWSVNPAAAPPRRA